MSWTFPKKSAVMLTLSLKNYAEKIHRTDSDTSAMVSQILLNTSKHPTSPSDLRTCHISTKKRWQNFAWQKTCSHTSAKNEIEKFFNFGVANRIATFSTLQSCIQGKKNTEEWTTDIVCQIIIFLLFFVNYLLITNNNNGLSISKACTSESKKRNFIHESK